MCRQLVEDVITGNPGGRTYGSSLNSPSSDKSLIRSQDLPLDTTFTLIITRSGSSFIAFTPTHVAGAPAAQAQWSEHFAAALCPPQARQRICHQQ
jgi:hypothetical protein